MLATNSKTIRLLKKEIKTALTRYVQVLQASGKKQVPLDRSARATLRQLREVASPSAPKPKPTAPRVTTEPASVPKRSESPASVAPSVEAMPAIVGGTKKEKLDNLAARARECQKCPHLVKFRHNVVFGVGDPEASLMFIGEAPGADEDMKGEPFVGRAGDTLSKMITAMGLTREQVYIANILKCRPDMPAGAPGNRKPTPDEMSTCSPYLLAQIEIIQPKVMVGLGASAVEGLLGAKGTISKLRGNFQEFRGIPFMPTFHPSYLLHNPTLETKRKVWEDLLQVMGLLKMPISEKQQGFFLAKPT